MLFSTAASAEGQEWNCVSEGRFLHQATIVTPKQMKNVGCILVTGERGELIGIFTEGDAQYKVAGLIHDLESVPVESLMTPRPSVLRSDTPISQALHLMGLHGFRHVPLVDGEGKPTGFISFRDIVRFIEQNFASKSVTA